jgi:hypothetical protein
MTVKPNVRKALRKLLITRRGTAEIVGSIMFLLIMMFFFTNVFLWHDRATREMDGVLSDKLNSLVSIQVVNSNLTEGKLTLNVTNNGGVGIVLSRLWITQSDDHNYADFETGDEFWVAAGDWVEFMLSDQTQYNADGSIKVEGATICYAAAVNVRITFKILTTRGNMAGCGCIPVKSPPS